jgi:hypothetical protein
MSDDKPRFQWSATEIVGIGIDNPERVRKTEDGPCDEGQPLLGGSND